MTSPENPHNCCELCYEAGYAPHDANCDEGNSLTDHVCTFPTMIGCRGQGDCICHLPLYRSAIENEDLFLGEGYEISDRVPTKRYVIRTLKKGILVANFETSGAVTQFLADKIEDEHEIDALLIYDTESGIERDGWDWLTDSPLDGTNESD